MKIGGKSLSGGSAIPVLLIIGFFAILTAFFSRDYGLSWDEPTRWSSGDRKLEFYMGFAGAESVRAHLENAPRDRYPGLYDIPLSAGAHSLNLDRPFWGSLWSAFFAMLAVLSAYLLSRVCWPGQRGIQAGAVAALSLLLIPSFFGHIFINPKDIPFAGMYGVGLLCVIRFVAALPRPRLVDTLLLGVGVGLCMAVRLPGGVLIVYAAIVSALWLIARRIEGEETLAEWFRLSWGILWRGALAGLIALLVLLPWWPAGFLEPFSAPTRVVGELHTSAGSIPLLFAGEIMDAQDGPRGYLLVMLLIKLPIFLTLLLLSGLLVMLALRKRGLLLGKTGKSPAYAVYVLVLGALFPVVYITLAQPALHNGIRHLLYLLVPFCSLAGLIAVWWWSEFAKFRRARLLLALIGACCLVWSVIVLVRLHPYQYVYYNAMVGGPAGSLGQFETEYWFTSTQHGIEALQRILDREPEMAPPGAEVVRILVSGPTSIAEPFLPDRFSLVSDPAQADFMILNTQMMVHTPYDGEVIYEVSRMGLPILQIKRTDGN